MMQIVRDVRLRSFAAGFVTVAVLCFGVEQLYCEPRRGPAVFGLDRGCVRKARSRMTASPDIFGALNHSISVQSNTLRPLPLESAQRPLLDWTPGVPAGPGVPFYLYEGPAFENWIDRCDGLGGGPANWDRAGVVAQDHGLTTLGAHRLTKHGNDLLFLEQALIHPWRTKDPEQAKLFVVPVLLGYAARHGKCGKMKAWKLLSRAAAAIKRLPYVARSQGRDHLVLSTDFKVYMTQHAAFKKLFPNFIFATQLHSWGSKVGASCAFAVPMNALLPLSQETVESLHSQTDETFWNRQHPVYFKGQIDTRAAYGARRRLGAALARLAADRPRQFSGAMFLGTKYVDPKFADPSLRVCSCPQVHGTATHIVHGALCIDCVENGTAGHRTAAARALSNPYLWDMPETQFAFQIRGDLPGSNRLYDIIKAGAIPVALSDDLEETLPFPDRVPWPELLVRLRERDIASGSEKAATALWAALDAANSTELRTRRALIWRHAKDLIWELNHSRVTSNVLLHAARHCLKQDV